MAGALSSGAYGGNPLDKARDIGNFAYETPDAARLISSAGGAGALGRYRGGSSAAHILDTAAAGLMDDLEEMKQRAQAAAMFSAMPPGSTGNIIGAGLEAKNAAQLGQYTIPIGLEQQGAEAILTRAQAEQAELQNQINQMNFGYLTAATGENVAAAGDLAAPGGAPAAGGAETGAGDLPLTEQSQMQLSALQRQLDRALRFAKVSPQARTDAYEIYDKMAAVVKDDPLAKAELQLRVKEGETQITTGADIDKRIREDIAKMTEDSYTNAQEMLKAIAANPQYSRIVADPAEARKWVDDTARGILQKRYGEYASQLRGQGINPDKYLGPTQAEAPDQLAEAGPAAPGAPAPAGSPAPAAGGASAVPPPAAPTDPLGGFKPVPLLPGEAFDINKELNVAGTNTNLLGQGIKDINRALELNEKSIEGFFSPVESILRKIRSGVWSAVGVEGEDETLNATAELQAILSSSVLQNLNALIKGNPTEGERAYVEKLGATADMTKGQRRVLLERAQKLLIPRLQFEQMRAEALAKGVAIRWTDYEGWLKSAYGPALAEAIRRGEIAEE